MDIIRNVAANFLDTAVYEIKRTHGGDINEAYTLSTGKGLIFLKVNKAHDFPEMFNKEKDGLDALRRLSACRVPKVLGIVEDQHLQFLFLEHIQQGSPSSDFWETFGAHLAHMHKQGNPKFGWHLDNYMGNLKQINTWTATWTDFFTRCRIMPLAEQLYQRQDFSKKNIQQVENLSRRTADIFPDESPAFVHGDLWSGNLLADEHGAPVLIDPAVSFSHREMDIGLTKLFGGFPQAFYDAYNEAYPLVHGWQDRLSLTQLYPLLFHAVAFGGSYIMRCKQIIAQYA